MSDAWAAAKYVGGKIAGNDKDAGLFSQFKADNTPIDKTAFDDPDAAKNKAQLQSYMDAAGSRAAPTATAATLGPVSTFGGATAAGTTIDTSKEAEGRAYQQKLLSQLSGMAAGTGPSLAVNQLQQGRDALLQQQAAAAGSMRPGNSALAMRNLGNQASMLGAQTNQQAANARIAEQLGALQQMGQASSAFRGQDQSTAQAQAALTQGTSLANAGFQQGAGLFNAGAQNDFTKTGAGFQQQTSLANQMMEMQQRGLSAQQAQFAMAAKLGISESEFAAKMAYEQSKANQQLGIAGIDSQAYANAQGNYYKMLSAVGQAVGASDERVKTDVHGGDASVRNFLDSYGARGMSSSPAEEKMNIHQGSDRIRAFLSALPGVNPHVPTLQTSAENPLMGLGQKSAAQTEKETQASAKESQTALDQKAASTDNAMMQGKLQDKAASADMAMRKSPGAGFDPSAYSGNYGLAANGAPLTMPTAPYAAPNTSPANVLGPMPQAQPMAPTPVPYGAADMATLNAISASNPQGTTTGVQMPTPLYSGMNIQQPGVTNIGPQYATAASDERTKTGVAPGFDAVERMMNDIKAHSYEYKDPQKPGRGEGEHYSPMAQEFSASPVGRSMLTHLPDGTLGVDYGKAGGVTFAALADLHARLKKLEGDDEPAAPAKPKRKVA